MHDVILDHRKRRLLGQPRFNFPGTSFRRLGVGNPLQKAGELRPEGQGIFRRRRGFRCGRDNVDPRDFTHKFMPYYRYTELSNGMEMEDFTVFGMWAINKKAALTYEVPIARKYDITGTANCAGLPEIPCFGTIPGGGYLPNGTPAEGDGVETGMGDSIVRIFGSWDQEFLGGAAIWGAQFSVPTATKDELGTETWTAGPIATFVWDFPLWPAPGAFFAMMNIFEFDIFKDSGRGDVGRYMGRWFLQLPMNHSCLFYIVLLH